LIVANFLYLAALCS